MVRDSYLHSNASVGAFVDNAFVHVSGTRFTQNDHTGLSVGYGGFVQFGGGGQEGFSELTYNAVNGLSAYAGSTVSLGAWFGCWGGVCTWQGGANLVHGNGAKNIVANDAEVWAQLTQWGGVAGTPPSGIETANGGVAYTDCYLLIKDSVLDNSCMTAGAAPEGNQGEIVASGSGAALLSASGDARPGRLARWREVADATRTDPAEAERRLDRLIAGATGTEARMALLHRYSLLARRDPLAAAQALSPLVWPTEAAAGAERSREERLAGETDLRVALARLLFYTYAHDLQDASGAERALAVLVEARDADVASGLLQVQYAAAFGARPALEQLNGHALPEALPTQLSVEAYPNPARGEATLRYRLPGEAHVRLALYDLLGREVLRLADGPHAAGTHTAGFDGGRLSSGVYLYRLEVDGEVRVGRLTFVR